MTALSSGKSTTLYRVRGNSMIFAIDPGSEKSAFVLWDKGAFIKGGILDNLEIMNTIISLPEDTEIVIEMVASYGMPVGWEIFETVFWIGRFYQFALRLKFKPERIYRKDVKITLCNSMKAKDSNIRQRLIDLIGDVGTKKEPGPLYGMRNAGGKDVWAALAIAITWAIQKNNFKDTGGQSPGYSQEIYKAYEGIQELPF